MTLKVKYQDFQQITRRKSCAQAVRDKTQFASIASELLLQTLPPPIGVRLLGLALSGLAETLPMESMSPVGQSIAEQQIFEFR